MKTNLLYEFKDYDLFAPIDPFEDWKLLVDKTPKKNPIGVLLPGGVYSEDIETMTPFIHKARLPLLFPNYHYEIKEYKEYNFKEMLEKNRL